MQSTRRSKLVSLQSRRHSDEGLCIRITAVKIHTLTRSIHKKEESETLASDKRKSFYWCCTCRDYIPNYLCHYFKEYEFDLVDLSLDCCSLSASTHAKSCEFIYLLHHPFKNRIFFVVARESHCHREPLGIQVVCFHLQRDFSLRFCRNQIHSWRWYQPANLTRRKS